MFPSSQSPCMHAFDIHAWRPQSHACILCRVSDSYACTCTLLALIGRQTRVILGDNKEDRHGASCHPAWSSVHVPPHSPGARANGRHVHVHVRVCVAYSL